MGVFFKWAMRKALKLLPLAGVLLLLHAAMSDQRAGRLSRDIDLDEAHMRRYANGKAQVPQHAWVRSTKASNSHKHGNVGVAHSSARASLGNWFQAHNSAA